MQKYVIILINKNYFIKHISSSFYNYKYFEVKSCNIFTKVYRFKKIKIVRKYYM